MKCQNCGRNEATYYYKSSINGRVTETHLCADCARKLGYVQRMQPDSFFGDDFFSHPFRLFEPLLGGFGNRLLTEFPEPVDVTRRWWTRRSRSASPCSVSATPCRPSCATPWRPRTSSPPPSCGIS